MHFYAKVRPAPTQGRPGEVMGRVADAAAASVFFESVGDSGFVFAGAEARAGIVPVGAAAGSPRAASGEASALEPSGCAAFVGDAIDAAAVVGVGLAEVCAGTCLGTGGRTAFCRGAIPASVSTRSI